MKSDHSYCEVFCRYGKGSTSRDWLTLKGTVDAPIVISEETSIVIALTTSEGDKQTNKHTNPSFIHHTRQSAGDLLRIVWTGPIV